MTLIEGIGDEVTHFFIGLFVIVVVTIAWWTTGISEQRHIRTVLLLDRRHRTVNISRRTLSNHTETITITEGSPTMIPNETAPVDDRIEEVSSSGEIHLDGGKPGGSSSAVQNDEQDSIIQAMDSDTCVLRQRRVAFYEHLNSASSTNDIDDETTQNEDLMEHNYADVTDSNISTNPEEDSNSIRIKLKYINDDLRLVDGNLEEKLGDFIKRHFEVELNSNKLVRLIFNGHVLHQDTSSLRSCGLFDNCVVHCLVHQKRNSQQQTGENVSRTNTEDGGGTSRTGTSSISQNMNNNQGREWDLGNVLFGFVSLILVIAWYFRCVYAHLYTVTATIGLILITGIFGVILIGMNFPDNEPAAARFTLHARVQQQQQ